MTFGSGGRRSIQLSYERKTYALFGLAPVNITGPPTATQVGVRTVDGQCDPLAVLRVQNA